MAILGLYGILVAVMLVGVVGEFLYRRDLTMVPRLKMAGKVCLAIGVGSVVGNLIEMVLAIGAVGIFLWNTWPLMVWG